ncbi:MAG: hypothetical protein LAP85_17755 [Acidobacteriia bacterium]|nr:hypothetical protein [Terriglobia bacterium]
MTACLTDGDLRACLDGELPPGAARTASQHLLSCERCRNHIELVRARAVNTAALMDCLEPAMAEFQQGDAAALARIHSRAPMRRGGWPMRWAALGAAGMVALLLLVVTPNRRHPASSEPAVGQQPVAQASGAGVGNPLQAASPVPQATSSLTPAKSAAPGKVDYYLALDNGEPIQMGFVVRMNLPASVLSPWEPVRDPGEIQADVIIDEGGRARAIRFLK